MNTLACRPVIKGRGRSRSTKRAHGCTPTASQIQRSLPLPLQSSPPQRGGYGHLKVRSVSPTLPFTKPTSTPKALFVRHRPPSVTKRGSGQREKRVWYGNSMLADQERGCCRGFQGRSQREPTPRPLNLTEVSSPSLPKGNRSAPRHCTARSGPSSPSPSRRKARGAWVGW